MNLFNFFFIFYEYIFPIFEYNNLYFQLKIPSFILFILKKNSFTKILNKFK